jgi:transposase
MIVRYVRLLTGSQRHTLAEIMKHEAIPRARVRAHGILLSSPGMKIKEIAEIYQVDRDPVAPWSKKWAQHGMASLSEKPRSGRPPKLTPAEQDLARQDIQEEPRCLQQVRDHLQQKTAKRLSISSLKRLAKKARLRWKRVRKSLKSWRDPEEWTQCQRELEA